MARAKSRRRRDCPMNKLQCVFDRPLERATQREAGGYRGGCRAAGPVGRRAVQTPMRESTRGWALYQHIDDLVAIAQMTAFY